MLFRSSRLIKVADTKIESISAKTEDNIFATRQDVETSSKHLVYDETGNVVGEEELPMKEESVGTNVFIWFRGSNSYMS